MYILLICFYPITINYSQLVNSYAVTNKFFNNYYISFHSWPDQHPSITLNKRNQHSTVKILPSPQPPTRKSLPRRSRPPQFIRKLPKLPAPQEPSLRLLMLLMLLMLPLPLLTLKLQLPLRLVSLVSIERLLVPRR